MINDSRILFDKHNEMQKKTCVIVCELYFFYVYIDQYLKKKVESDKKYSKVTVNKFINIIDVSEYKKNLWKNKYFSMFDKCIEQIINFVMQNGDKKLTIKESSKDQLSKILFFMIQEHNKIIFD